jgi:hypothetical protein
LEFYKTAKKMIEIDRQNFVTNCTLFFRKDITIKKNASATVENFKKLGCLADFYLKRRGVSINSCFYCN